MDVKPERNALPTVAAAFWRENGEVMFQFVIDPGNIVGPRLANKADSENHPEAWFAFTSGDEPEAVIETVPDAVEPEPPAEPKTVVPEKDMDGFEERIAPAPPKAKRRTAKRGG